MNNENNTTQETARTVRVPQRVPGFDPMKFAREVVNKAGETVLTLDLKHKKAWFRMACPTGGLALNALRITDTMAIFEARVFADVEDRNPLASFTATQTADKAKDTAYIRTAQDAALEEALERAGFSLQTWSMSPRESHQEMTEATGAGQPVETPKETSKAPAAMAKMDSSKQMAGDNAPQSASKTGQPPKPTADTAPRPAPVGPPPHAPGVLASSTGGTQTCGDAGSKPAGAPVVDISTAKLAEKTHPAVEQEQAGKAAQASAESAPAPDASAPANEEIPPVTYTPDMTVEEIRQHMTLEQAKAIKVEGGTCKGWTLEQVAADRPSSLKWLRYTAPFADNVLKAAADILLNDLELKKAG